MRTFFLCLVFLNGALMLFNILQQNFGTAALNFFTMIICGFYTREAK